MQKRMIWAVEAYAKLVAEEAYAIADAMLSAREPRQPGGEP